MTEFAEIADWLRNEAENCMKQAIARRPREMRNATQRDLDSANRIAEKMAGRKLPRISIQDNLESCDIQDRIADKLEKEAKRLYCWADFILKQEEPR